jgi:hypothetical protein
VCVWLSLMFVFCLVLYIEDHVLPFLSLQRNLNYERKTVVYGMGNNKYGALGLGTVCCLITKIK